MHSIVKSMRDGFTVHALDDGNDYWSVVERFRAGTLSARTVPNRKPHVRRVFFLEEFDRPMVLKWEMGSERRLERLIWHAIHGPFLSTQMRRVHTALDCGCHVTQNIYLVAERMRGPICVESFWLGQYISGRPLTDYVVEEMTGLRNGEDDVCSRDGDWVDLNYHDVASNIHIRIPVNDYNGISFALRDLHAHGLALCDLHPSNILIGTDGVRIIDLNNRGLLCLSVAKDINRARMRYGIDIRPTGLRLRISCWYESLLDLLRQLKRRIGIRKKHRQKGRKNCS